LVEAGGGTVAQFCRSSKVPMADGMNGRDSG
jgi:hypothetical protein